MDKDNMEIVVNNIIINSNENSNIVEKKEKLLDDNSSLIGRDKNDVSDDAWESLLGPSIKNNPSISILENNNISNSSYSPIKINSTSVLPNDSLVNSIQKDDTLLDEDRDISNFEVLDSNFSPINHTEVNNNAASILAINNVIDEINANEENSEMNIDFNVDEIMVINEEVNSNNNNSNPTFSMHHIFETEIDANKAVKNEIVIETETIKGVDSIKMKKDQILNTNKGTKSNINNKRIVLAHENKEHDSYNNWLTTILSPSKKSHPFFALSDDDDETSSNRGHAAIPRFKTPQTKPTDSPEGTACVVCNNKGSYCCSVCGEIRYCSKDCEKNGWNAHKSTCNNIGKRWIGNTVDGDVVDRYLELVSEINQVKVDDFVYYFDKKSITSDKVCLILVILFYLLFLIFLCFILF
jgi:hypothetical protein